MNRFALLALAIPIAVAIGWAWGRLAASIARKRHWSPRGCRMASLPLLLLAAVVMLGCHHTGSFRHALQFVFYSSAVLSGMYCRKLVYPELGWRDADPPEITTLHLNR